MFFLQILKVYHAYNRNWEIALTKGSVKYAHFWLATFDFIGWMDEWIVRWIKSKLGHIIWLYKA